MVDTYFKVRIRANIATVTIASQLTSENCENLKWEVAKVLAREKPVSLVRLNFRKCEDVGLVAFDALKVIAGSAIVAGPPLRLINVAEHIRTKTQLLGYREVLCLMDTPQQGA